jgi:hypothetical protein
MELSNLFITGCDSSTRWQLPWFEKHFKTYNPDANLYVFDFDTMFPDLTGWFKKTAALIAASKIAKSVCWLDTDCKVVDNIEDVFDYVEPNKIAIAQDQPWTTRRQETWHNTGVVAFGSLPRIVYDWAIEVENIDQGFINKHTGFGDQDVLHALLNTNMRRAFEVTTLPKMFNTLRIDYIDGTVPDKVKVIHYTGHKGNLQIKEQIEKGL